MLTTLCVLECTYILFLWYLLIKLSLFPSIRVCLNTKNIRGISTSKFVMDKREKNMIKQYYVLFLKLNIVAPKYLKIKQTPLSYSSKINLLSETRERIFFNETSRALQLEMIFNVTQMEEVNGFLTNKDLEKKNFFQNDRVLFLNSLLWIWTWAISDIEYYYFIIVPHHSYVTSINYCYVLISSNVFNGNPVFFAFMINLLR